MRVGYYFNKLIYGFFMLFFFIYIGKFGIANLILEPTNKWKIIFNLGVWSILVSYCMDKFFDNKEVK